MSSHLFRIDVRDLGSGLGDEGYSISLVSPVEVSGDSVSLAQVFLSVLQEYEKIRKTIPNFKPSEFPLTDDSSR